MKRHARVAASLVVLFATVALLPLLASANHQDVDDANDVKGILDVKRVQVKGTRASPKWRIVTFSSWSATAIWDGGYGLVHLDTLGDEHFDYYALVRSNGYGLEATLWRHRRKSGDTRLGKLHVARSDRRSFTVKIPLRKLKIPEARLVYRWYAQTLVTSDACPRACLDRAPDAGAVTEPLAGRTPPSTTPTIPPIPSITATPTPSASS